MDRGRPLSLWARAQALWGRPDVRRACLTLQDDYGQCAPLLLWRVWAFERELEIDAVGVDAAAAIAQTWTQSVIEPLRIGRRRLEARGDDPALRDRVLKNEIDAEHALLGALEAATTRASGRPSAPTLADALLEVCAVWGKPLGVGALDELLRAISRSEPADVG